jgi:NACalpha-BTF3-like transcription factor
MSIFSSWLQKHAAIPPHKFTADDILKAVNLVQNVAAHDLTPDDVTFIEDVSGVDNNHIISALIAEVQSLKAALSAKG